MTGHGSIGSDGSADITAGPYTIKRMALQVELDDGRIMTFYSGGETAAAGEVSVTAVYPPDHWPRGVPMIPVQRTPDISVTVEHLTGYSMTLRHADGAGPDLMERARKELTP